MALVAAGCGDEKTTDPEPRVPGPTDTIVVFERSGGIVGLDDRLSVRPDGAARVETRAGTKVVDLSAGELEELRSARARVDLAKLDPRYGPDPPPDDGITIRITADGRTVTTVSGGEPPPELERLVAVCIRITERHAPR